MYVCFCVCMYVCGARRRRHRCMQVSICSYIVCIHILYIQTYIRTYVFRHTYNRCPTSPPPHAYMYIYACIVCIHVVQMCLDIYIHTIYKDIYSYIPATGSRY